MPDPPSSVKMDPRSQQHFSTFATHNLTSTFYDVRLQAPPTKFCNVFSHNYEKKEVPLLFSNSKLSFSKTGCQPKIKSPIFPAI